MSLTTCEAGVDDDVLFPVEPEAVKGNLAKLAHGVRLTRGHDVIVRLVMLRSMRHIAST